MGSAWQVGDKVETNLEHAWVYAGTEREYLMGRRRTGRVVEVPLSVKTSGEGTLLIKWDSLTPTPLKRSEWWTHSSLITRSA